MMQMWFYWGYDCTFLFNTWTTKSEDKGLFLLGCFIVLLFSAFGQVLRWLKQDKIKKGDGAQWLIILFQAVIFAHEAFNMLLIMTYNYAVVLAVVLGHLVGYLTLNMKEEFKNPESENLADCC